MPESVIECATACTVTVVHELSLPPLQLNAEEGAAIASAVLVIWSIGWAVRMLIRTLSTGDSPQNSE